jgi:cob(I)alamin adenosyltransferase
MALAETPGFMHATAELAASALTEARAIARRSGR